MDSLYSLLFIFVYLLFSLEVNFVKQHRMITHKIMQQMGYGSCKVSIASAQR